MTKPPPTAAPPSNAAYAAWLPRAAWIAAGPLAAIVLVAWMTGWPVVVAWIGFFVLIGVMVVCWLHLETDIVQMSIVGTFGGCIVGVLLKGYLSPVDVVGGLLVGSMLGDAFCDLRTAGLARGRAREAPPWWLRAPTPPVWLRATAWLSMLLSLLAAIMLLGIYLSWAEAQGREAWKPRQAIAMTLPQSLAASATALWPVYLLILIGGFAAWRVKYHPWGSVLSNRLHHRVAVALALAILVTAAWWGASVFGDLFRAQHAAEDGLSQLSQRLLTAMQLTQPLLLCGIVPPLLLGRRFDEFFRRFSWLPAAALAGAVAGVILVAGAALAISWT